jgi:predicted sulfurtransferase
MIGFGFYILIRRPKQGKPAKKDRGSKKDFFEKEDHDMKKKIAVLAALAVSLAFLAVGSLSFAQEAKRMTKKELKAMLDNPDLVLLDVRTGKDWTGSEEKIKGALREDPGKLDEWADKFDKGKTVVLYCA